MAHAIEIDTLSTHRAGVPTHGRRAFRMLHFGFALLPIVAGFDKLAGLFVDWHQYLTPAIARAIPLSALSLMRTIGVVEIAAGVLVALRPRIGAYVVAAWMAGIIANIAMLGAHYDIALRDFGLMIGALALGTLSHVYDASPKDQLE